MAITGVMTITVKQVVVAILEGYFQYNCLYGEAPDLEGGTTGSHKICVCNRCYFTVNVLDLPFPSPMAIYS